MVRLSSVRLCHAILSPSYVQGQSPKLGLREYFYFIDHQGMLFLDDARIKNFTSCFKEIKFLSFFFTRLTVNDTDRFPEFPYVSPCGREKNFVRCDDLPLVFTALKENSNGSHVLNRNYCDDKLDLPFQPSKIFMGPSGRLYHPAPEKLHGVGLVRSQLAIELSKGFRFNDDEPTHLEFGGQVHQLDNSLKDVVAKFARKE